MSRETAKNYEDRIANRDFERYLHGKGIDIGGGSDCLILPEGVEGKVQLWDLQDGDAQYLHSIKDNTFDFVYSSHCLEHMRDVKCALSNWIRVCKVGGVLYICVPHETWYEKGIWPSRNNRDHKHSFTAYEKSNLPCNIVVRDLLSEFEDVLDIIEIRENLKNYNFECDTEIDQTEKFEDMVCAQIDFIVRKKKINLSDEWRRANDVQYYKDYWHIMVPILIRMKISKILPQKLKQIARTLKIKLRK